MQGVSHLEVRLASSEADLKAAARLRYEVFVRELGAHAPQGEDVPGFEHDRFDPYCAHIVLVDTRRDVSKLDHVVGVYRLLTEEAAEKAGQFYSEGEYDLALVRASGKRLLELGRSCVHRDYRNGFALNQLWLGLAGFVREREIELLFGVASFKGTNPEKLAAPLSHLYHAHLAPPALRVRALPGAFEPMNRIPAGQIDRVAAMRAVPQLIKSYLRLGGAVGDGAFVDHAFNTIDICLVLDTTQLTASAKARYLTGQSA